MNETIRSIDVSPASERGKEVQEIVNIMLAVNVPKAHIHAALLGLAGVSASCWPDYLLASFNEKASTPKDHKVQAG